MSTPVSSLAKKSAGPSTGDQNSRINIVKVPVVELSQCTLCGICVEVCPVVFKLNKAGYIEVAELSVYPLTEADEAIKNCPTDCINWAEIRGAP